MFVEAVHGDLQNYLNLRNDSIDLALRLKWCKQSAEAIRYIHEKAVIHSDLRPENYLLHTNMAGSLGLYLCDFGGSVCGDLDGGNLPDSGFFDPNEPWISSPATDIFSLGSIFYTIMTGHWPHKSFGPFNTVEEKHHYEQQVDDLFSKAIWPDVDGLVGAVIMHRCWTKTLPTAEAVLREQEKEYSEGSTQTSLGRKKSTVSQGLQT